MIAQHEREWPGKGPFVIAQHEREWPGKVRAEVTHQARHILSSSARFSIGKRPGTGWQYIECFSDSEGQQYIECLRISKARASLKHQDHNRKNFMSKRATFSDFFWQNLSILKLLSLRWFVSSWDQWEPHRYFSHRGRGVVDSSCIDLAVDVLHASPGGSHQSCN